MPATSKRQYRFMEAAAHNPAFAKKAGIKPKAAKEFVAGQSNYAALPEHATLRSRAKRKLNG